jgi:RHS repeat-associated protein
MPFLQQNLLCLYCYDPLDRLISHTQSQRSPLQRFYCKSRLATEIQGALHHSIVQHGDLLFAQQQQRQNDALDTALLATDLQRSVLHTLKANHQRQPIAYSPYGHRRPENGLLSLMGFNGERPDPVTGHYLLGNGYRAFNPVLMRFNSPDSLSPFGKGGVNSYAYCLGDPINMSDSNGRFGFNFQKLRRFFKFSSRFSYKNGQGKVFTEGASVVDNVVNANGTWWERTTRMDHEGKWVKIKTVKYNGDVVRTKARGAAATFRKPNASLQELSYSKLSTAEIQNLPKNPSYRNTDPRIDVVNMSNALHELHHRSKTKFSPPVRYDDDARIITLRKVIAGEIRGVDPKKIWGLE